MYSRHTLIYARISLNFTEALLMQSSVSQVIAVILPWNGFCVQTYYFILHTNTLLSLSTLNTRVGTLIVTTIYLQLIQN